MNETCPSSHPEVAFKFISGICRQNIFIKTYISVKIAPHIGCNRRQDRNEITASSELTRLSSSKEKSSISFNNNGCAAILYFGGKYIGW